MPLSPPLSKRFQKIYFSLQISSSLNPPKKSLFSLNSTNDFQQLLGFLKPFSISLLSPLGLYNLKQSNSFHSQHLFHTFQYYDVQATIYHYQGGYFYSFTLLYIYSCSIIYYFVLIYSIVMLIYFMPHCSAILLYLHSYCYIFLLGRFFIFFMLLLCSILYSKIMSQCHSFKFSRYLSKIRHYSAEISLEKI